ncbi:RNase P modulator RnpM [Anoxynatronum buryatiense]|uniref:YlxR domain-containing protein n=1 Tax=Anoxynatronum buryatiense TaxID=489973 RepID=A0AA46AI80_9CLOT|nr:YlxR family protein [Anoxynatronum buryatiense]SMP47570.1 hypothetical protein SAMN06296020_103160 [Anoxynatronum buryatiense]
MNPKKTPLRKCIACQEMKNKKDLIRIVANKEGQVHLDSHGKAHGRGAYVCRQTECFEKIKKTKALNRAFKRDVPDEVYTALAEKFQEGSDH